MDIRRTILWMIFVFSAFMLWNNWQTYHGHPSLLGGQQTAQQNTQKSSDSTPNAPTAAASTANVDAKAPTTSTPAQLVNVNNGVLNLKFSTLGAQIVFAELVEHHDSEDNSKATVLLQDTENNKYLVQSGLVGAGKNYPSQTTPFKLVSSNLEMTGDSLPVVFESEADGIKVVRTYTLNKNSYRVDVKDEITNTSTEAQSPALYLQITRDDKEPAGTSSFYHTFTGPAVYSNEEHFQKVAFSDIAKNKASYVKQANDGWIGMVQHYFVTAWVPPQDKPRSIEMRKTSSGLYAVSTVEPLGSVAPNATVTTDSVLWVGPQDQKALSQIAPGMDLVVDYGWLTIIAKPMFQLMTWIHSLLGNWGWTIVALTCLIKLLMYPLSAASYKSMAKMKNVAPRMQALKEKFGDDKQKLNGAMMEMYRTEKINPLGGCLPMIVQIPVFLTLYRVILGSVEMRGAPWLGWIHDLSLHDPYFILPVFMMGSMFLQMRLNPKPPDPMQAKIMMFMPLIFGGMMFMFPAGLVLYWCINNSLSIVQQWTITRNLDKINTPANDSNHTPSKT